MRFLFVCSGNTCRSPMAKIIMEHKLKEIGMLDKFEIDSACLYFPTLNMASKEAREVIRIKYGEDLLASHRPKRITPSLIRWADIILTMTTRLKEGLPQGKVFTLKEFAGSSGDISDPFGEGQTAYLIAADEISETIAKITTKLLNH